MTRRLLPWLLAVLVLGTIAEAQQVRAGLINLASMVTGTLPVGNGGTGATSLAAANIAVTTGKLSQFASTTSSELAGVLSDETGSGALAFATSPTLVTPTLGSATATFLGIGIGTTPDIAGSLLHARSNATTVVDSQGLVPRIIVSGAAPDLALLSTTYSTDVSNAFYVTQQTTGVTTMSVGNGTLATSNKGNKVLFDPTNRFIELYPGSSAGFMRVGAVNDPTNGSDINSLILPFYSRIDGTTHYANVNFQARPTDGTNEARSNWQQLWEMTWTNAGGFTQDLVGLWDEDCDCYAYSAYVALPQTLRVGYAVSGKHYTLQLNGLLAAADPTTRTASTPVIDVSQTWNSSGTAFTGIKGNFTSTASAAGSLLMDLQLGAASKWSVDKSGNVTAAGTFNKVTLTAPASGSTLTIANGKTLTASNTLTFTGTDGSSVAFGAGGTAAYTDKANTFGAFAQSFASATLLLVPTSAGYAPTADGSLGYDSTQDAWSVGGAGGLNGKLQRTLNVGIGSSDTITASVVGTTITDFATTFTLPANFFAAAGKTVRVTVNYKYTSSGSPPTLRLRGQFGATGSNTELLKTTALAPVTSQTNVGFGIQYTITSTATPGAAVNTITSMVGIPYSNINTQNATAQPVAAATNGALTITHSVEWSANTAGNSITLLSVMVEELN